MIFKRAVKDHLMNTLGFIRRLPGANRQHSLLISHPKCVVTDNFRLKKAENYILTRTPARKLIPACG
jgi:hypothetical protein